MGKLNHLIYYKERLAANLEGHEWENNPDGRTFYLTDQSNDDMDWKTFVNWAENAQCNLRQVLSTFSDEKLDHTLEGKLLDIILHDAYHTGQMIQL